MPVDWTQIFVVGIPATLGAIAGLVNAKKLDKADKKLETLDRNGGSSMRDDIDKIVKGLKTTSDHLASQDRAIAGIGLVVDSLQADHGELKNKLGHFEERVQGDEVKLARYIVHEANNTLQASRLLEEEKRILATPASGGKKP